MIIQYSQRNEGDYQYSSYISDKGWSLEYSQKLWGSFPQIVPEVTIVRRDSKYEYKYADFSIFVRRRVKLGNTVIEERKGPYLFHRPDSVAISSLATNFTLEVRGKYSWLGRKMSEVPTIWVNGNATSYSLKQTANTMPNLSGNQQMYINPSSMSMFNKESTYDFSINSDARVDEYFDLLELLLFPHVLRLMMTFQGKDINIKYIESN
jgi:hypothetical protein